MQNIWGWHIVSDFGLTGHQKRQMTNMLSLSPVLIQQNNKTIVIQHFHLVNVGFLLYSDLILVSVNGHKEL